MSDNAFASGNVDSAAGDVEPARSGESRRLFRPVAAMMLACLAFSGLGFGGAGCVETAECTASVACPKNQVCYEYQCRTRCEDTGQCGPNQVCAPCLTVSGTQDQGKCFGQELKACVAGEG